MEDGLHLPIDHSIAGLLRRNLEETSTDWSVPTSIVIQDPMVYGKNGAIVYGATQQDVIVAIDAALRLVDSWEVQLHRQL